MIHGALSLTEPLANTGLLQSRFWGEECRLGSVSGTGVSKLLESHSRN